MNEKDKNNGNKPAITSPLDTLPKIVQQIVINLHVGGRVTGQMPTDPKILFYMIGEFLKQVGLTMIYNPPSPIVKAPAGLVIPSK